MDNTTTASWSGLGLLLDSPPYSIEFFDEDLVSGDDPLGTYNIPANGEGTYFINVAGGTTGSLVIDLEPQQVFTDTDTIVVFPAPDLVLSANGSQLCVANDTLACYVWFMDGDTVPSASTACIATQGPGVYTVTGTNAFGCTTVSNELVVCPTLSIARNGNVLFVADEFDSYAWTLNGAPIGNDEPFVFTDGDGTYALTATNANGCTVTASYLLSTVGLEEIATASFPLALYPNPNDGRFTVVAEGLEEPVVQVEVHDAMGRMVHQQSVPTSAGTLQLALVLDLGPGAYWVRMTDGRSVAAVRFIR